MSVCTEHGRHLSASEMGLTYRPFCLIISAAKDPGIQLPIMKDLALSTLYSRICKVGLELNQVLLSIWPSLAWSGFRRYMNLISSLWIALPFASNRVSSL